MSLPVKSPFPLPLNVHVVQNGRCATLLSPFAYVDGDLSVDVPAGFVTDWNSSPKPFWNVFPPWLYPEAAIIHDFLYRNPGSMSRAAVDAVHRRILELLGCPAWKRWAAWVAIRTFGGKQFGLGLIPKACTEQDVQR